VSRLPRADALLHNGRIHTFAAKARAASAVATWGGRILAVGGDELEDLAGPGTRRIDLAGRTLVPGLIDSHCHADNHALMLERWHDVGWPRIASVQALLALVAEAHRRLPTGDWVIGFGYDDHKCGRYPSRDELDQAAPGRPVWLYRTDGHIAIVNSAALERFGVAEDTPDPPNGQYLRDPASGRMTGVLREMASWNLAGRLKAAYTADDYASGLRRVFDRYLEQGITSIHNSLTPRKAIDAYQRLREAGALRLRVGLILDGRDDALVEHWLEAGVRTGFGDEWLRLQGVEWCPDCSTSGRTAAYYEPYVGRPVPGEPAPNRGMLLYEREALVERVARAHRAGLRVCVEGVGDRGIDFALDAIEAALSAHPVADHRSRVEHCCCVTPSILERLRALGVIDSSATGFLYSLGDAYINHRGEAQMAFMWPHRALLDAGVHAAGHSDAPICDVNPWPAIGALVTRTTDSGRTLGPAQAVTPAEALRAYTVEGAFIGFEERLKGSIEPGKLADFALLDRDPLACEPEAIKDIRVEMTFVAGEPAYAR